MKQFRTFLRNSIRRGIIPPLDMDGWKILEEEVDAVYLNWDEIKKIFHVNLSRHPHLLDYRDDFVLGCMTAQGINTIYPDGIYLCFCIGKKQEYN